MGLTLILARELRGRGVTVTAIAPGPTATGLFLDGKGGGPMQALSVHSPPAIATDLVRCPHEPTP